MTRSTQQLLTEILQRMGDIDILVNNAGVSARVGGEMTTNLPSTDLSVLCL
jgi:NAD(P)-dependent dehydrogenase (short-subunit alcohol dehydrogenase family)